MDSEWLAVAVGMAAEEKAELNQAET